MTTTYLDSAALTERVNELETINESFLSEIGVMNDTEATLSGLWEGEAKEAFSQAYRNDSIQMKNFYNAIRIYVQVLRIIISNYVQIERQNAECATARSYRG